MSFFIGEESQVCLVYFVYYTHYLLEFNNSLISISNKAAICDNVSKLGCTSLVHQRETVVSFLLSVWASHLLVLPCSTSTTFNRFIGFFGIIICVSCKYTYFSQHFRHKNHLRI